MTIAPSGDVVFVADRATGRVLAIRSWRESAETQILAGELDHVAAMAMEGDQLLVATAQAVAALDPAEGTVIWRCDAGFEVTRLDRLTAGVYALIARRSFTEPLQVLSGGPEGKVYFVPGRPLD